MSNQRPYITWIIRSHISQDTDSTMDKRKGEKDKEWSTKHYIENYRLSNTNPQKKRGYIQVLRSSQQWHPLCNRCHKTGDKLWLKKKPNWDYSKHSWSFVTHIYRKILLEIVHFGNDYINLIIRNHWLGFFLLAATLWNHDDNYKLYCWKWG
jgi:hypothetical protein